MFTFESLDDLLCDFCYLCPALLVLEADSPCNRFVSRGLGPANVTSNDIRQYLLAGEAHPARLFPQCFSKLDPVAAITYEWRLSLSEVLSFLNPAQVSRCGSRFRWAVPTEMRVLRVWIDVLFIDQLSDDIAGSLAEARRVYANAPFHLALATETLLTRAWCLFELAVRRHALRETLLVESALDRPDLRVAGFAERSRMRFFEEMKATVEGDKQQIRREILAAFSYPENFNRQMGGLFRAATD